MSDATNPEAENLERELANYMMPRAPQVTAAEPQAIGTDSSSDSDDTTDTGAVDEGEGPPVPATPVALDDATVAVAQQVAKTPWYASWTTGALIPAAPIVALVMGIFGGSSMLIDWSSLAIIVLFIFGPLIGSIWLALHLGHRSRVKYIREAARVRRAWALTGTLDDLGRRTIIVGNRAINTVHHFKIPKVARTKQCSVLFADGNFTGVDDPADTGTGQVIRITGPDGTQIYPPTGALPALFQVPAVIASVLVSLAFTTACNAQSQTYTDAAKRLRDINAATPCTPQSKPGDDCTSWVTGTVAYEGYYTITTVNGSTFSTCRSVLQWANNRQEGDLRINGIDCTTQLSSKAALPARIQVLRVYAIQAQIGQSIYKTDRWPPLGETANSLALIFHLATIIWFAWPIVHFVTAISYRLLRAMSATRGAAAA